MTDRAIACLVSSDFAATAKFYRYFGFEIVSEDESILHRAREGVEFFFFARAEPLAWDKDRLTVETVANVTAWRETFARTRMSCKAMGCPGLTQINDGAWGVPAFNVSDRDGDMIWVVQQMSPPPAPAVA